MTSATPSQKGTREEVGRGFKRRIGDEREKRGRQKRGENSTISKETVKKCGDVLRKTMNDQTNAVVE
jgi:hypothetical protein